MRFSYGDDLLKMVEPDPWNVIDNKNQENTDNNCVTTQSSNGSDINQSTFEDNFIPENASFNFPDSKEYIQSLGIAFAFFSSLYFVFVSFQHCQLDAVL